MADIDLDDPKVQEDVQQGMDFLNFARGIILQGEAAFMQAQFDTLREAHKDAGDEAAIRAAMAADVIGDLRKIAGIAPLNAAAEASIRKEITGAENAEAFGKAMVKGRKALLENLNKPNVDEQNPEFPELNHEALNILRAGPMGEMLQRFGAFLGFEETSPYFAEYNAEKADITAKFEGLFVDKDGKAIVPFEVTEKILTEWTSGEEKFVTFHDEAAKAHFKTSIEQYYEQNKHDPEKVTAKEMALYAMSLAEGRTDILMSHEGMAHPEFDAVPIKRNIDGSPVLDADGRPMISMETSAVSTPEGRAAFYEYFEAKQIRDYNRSVPIHNAAAEKHNAKVEAQRHHATEMPMELKEVRELGTKPHVEPVVDEVVLDGGGGSHEIDGGAGNDVLLDAVADPKSAFGAVYNSEGARDIGHIMSADPAVMVTTLDPEIANKIQVATLSAQDPELTSDVKVQTNDPVIAKVMGSMAELRLDNAMS
ncbi:MAG: hypothetical protein ACRBCT_00190 [Alphaproteobacteria bacterium]